jgi:hypothetical protein
MDDNTSDGKKISQEKRGGRENRREREREREREGE